MVNKFYNRVVAETVEYGRCLVKITRSNKKQVYNLVKDCETDGTVRAVSLSCGKNKYILFVDAVGSLIKNGTLIRIDFKSKKAVAL